MAVGIRVNPDVTTETHPYISTGKSGIKFGVPVDQVPAAADFIAAHPRLRLTTLAMHLGSQLSDTDPFRQGIGRLLELAARCRAEGRHALEVLDIGGGLGIRYRDEQAMDPDAVRGGGGAAAGARAGTPSTWSPVASWWEAPGCWSPRCSIASIRAARNSSWWTRG